MVDYEVCQCVTPTGPRIQQMFKGGVSKREQLNEQTWGR